MTDEELSRYVTDGKVPEWYQAALDNPSGVKTEVTATEAKGTGGDDVR